MATEEEDLEQPTPRRGEHVCKHGALGVRQTVGPAGNPLDQGNLCWDDLRPESYGETCQPQPQFSMPPQAFRT